MKSNRDLLVLMKDDSFNQNAMEVELEKLNQLLFDFETIDNVSTAHEVFDLNLYKIICKPNQIKQVISKKELKPFVFLSNKN